MKKVLFVLKTEWGEMLRQSKLFLIIFFIVVLYEGYFAPMSEICVKTEAFIQPFEPFIYLCTKQTNIVLVPIIFIFLLSRFPFCKQQYFQMLRTGKKEWLVGEILFLVTASLVLLFIIFGGSVILLADRLAFTESWGSFMIELGESHPEIYNENSHLFLDASTIAHGKPLAVFLYTFGSMWSYLVLMGVLMLFGGMIRKTFALMISALVITALGGASAYFGGSLQWLMPLVHIRFDLHFNSIFAAVNFPLWGSFIYLLGLLVSVTVLCVLSLRNMEIGEAL